MRVCVYMSVCMLLRVRPHGDAHNQHENMLLIGPNPIHQVHVHFFWIYLWLTRIIRAPLNSIALLMDCQQPDACLGEYGRGLSRALLSEPVWLPQLEAPLVVEQAKFSLGGAFPFSLRFHQEVSWAL